MLNSWHLQQPDTRRPRGPGHMTSWSHDYGHASRLSRHTHGLRELGCLTNPDNAQATSNKGSRCQTLRKRWACWHWLTPTTQTAAKSLFFYQSDPWKTRSWIPAAFKEAHARLERNTKWWKIFGNEQRAWSSVDDQNDHQGGLDDKEDESNGKIFERPSSKRCPVKLIEKYLSHLNPECSSLFQKPRSPCTSFNPAEEMLCGTARLHLDTTHLIICCALWQQELV